MLLVGAAVSKGVGLIVGLHDPPVFDGGRPWNFKSIVMSYSTRSDKLQAFMMNTFHTPAPDKDAKSTATLAWYVPLCDLDQVSGHSVVTWASPTELSAPPTDTAFPWGETVGKKVSKKEYEIRKPDR